MWCNGLQLCITDKKKITVTDRSVLRNVMRIAEMTIPRRAIDIVWNDGASDINQSIIENQMSSLDVQSTGILLEI
jgi:Holliday junction resolvasome RuvABC ATP-dependent DNA helicase subunit